MQNKPWDYNSKNYSPPKEVYFPSKNRHDTSWQKMAKWYNKSLNQDSFHQNLVIPNTVKLLKLEKTSSLLDLGCGQGILGKNFPHNFYQGLDLSKSLIDIAKRNDQNPLHHFAVADATQSLSIDKKDFTHAAFILSLQNMEKPDLAIINASKHLISGGKLVIVLNHPCFRIPRQTFWEIDQKNKIEFRRINRYLTPLKIPIKMHPSRNNSPITWSFHFAISDYSKFLQKAGFLIEKIEEWTSAKISLGKAAKRENRAREEFPLFLTFVCQKSKLVGY